MIEFVEVPVLPPNTKDGGYAVGCIGPGGKEIGYPAGTQTHALVRIDAIEAVEPDVYQPGATMIRLLSGRAICVFMCVDGVSDLIRRETAA